jgi:tyrosyl-tRNA synthetase
MIGDPGGKNAERSFLDPATLAANVAAIDKQVATILSNLQELCGHTFEYEVINNISFYEELTYIDFLREIGKQMTINQMISKETVKRRIEDPEQSISYTEFSYMLMQGYDFFRLYQDYNCQLQIAGSDQWGNVVTGIELIRKKLDQQAFGATCPLILDSTGKKFGKSEGNAIWLDPTKNSPFSVYQYFMNTTDEDVERYLKLFTLLSFGQIEEIVRQHQLDKSQRVGQQKLAYYVTMSIFGKEAAANADLITCTLFGDCNPAEEITTMTTNQLEAFHQATGAHEAAPGRIIELLCSSELCESN